MKRRTKWSGRHAAIALLLLASPAAAPAALAGDSAQDSAQHGTPDSAEHGTPDSAQGSGPAAASQQHPHGSLRERFAAANSTHDGHLTLDQAQQGMPMVARHFAAIDRDHRGYVTLRDIREYARTRRAERRGAATPAPAG